MNNRWIVVTGSSSGIGYYCAKELQARGWNVIATVRRDCDMERLAGENLTTVQMDYARPETIVAAAATIAKLTGGKLDALFNNGAYAQKGALEDLPAIALREQFEANVIGWHDLTRRLLPLMRENGGGRIIQLSSFLGLVALRWRGAYTASKFAIEALSDTLRLELRGTGIYVSLIEPGPIETGFGDTAFVHFQKYVDVENSHFRNDYAPLFERFEKGQASPLTLTPDAVFRKVCRALESRRPKARYQVTLVTPMFVWLKTLLPQPLLDRFLYWASDK